MKKILLLLVIVLIFVNSFLAISYKKAKIVTKDLKYKVYQLNQKLDFFDLKIFTLLDGLRKNLEYDNFMVDRFLQLSSEKDSIFLADLGFESPKLVLRYSELNCQVCVDSQFLKLNYLAQKIGEENIIILGSYDDIDDLNRFRRINN